MPVSGMILSHMQTHRLNYTDNVWNTLLAERSELCRRQQPAARYPSQYYGQEEETICDNDDDDVLELNDHDLFILE